MDYLLQPVNNRTHYTLTMQPWFKTGGEMKEQW